VVEVEAVVQPEMVEAVVVQPEEQPSVEVTKAGASTAVEVQEELGQEPLEVVAEAVVSLLSEVVAVVAVVASMVQAPNPVIVEQLAERQEQEEQEEQEGQEEQEEREAESLLGADQNLRSLLDLQSLLGPTTF